MQIGNFRMIRCAIWIAAFALVLGLVRVAAAQEPTAAPAPVDGPPVTIEQVEEIIRGVNDNVALDDVAKSNLLAIYNRAVDQVRVQAEHEQRAALFEEEIRAAPVQAEELAAKNEAAVVPAAIDSGLTLVEYEQQLIEAQAALEALKNQVTGLEAETGRRTERRRELADLQTAANAELLDNAAQAGAPPAAGDSAETVLARQALLRATKQALTAKLRAYDAELRNYDIRRSLNLVSLRTDDAVRERRLLEERVQALEAAIQAERSRMAQQTASDAARAGEDIVIPAAQYLREHDGTRAWIESLPEENRVLAAMRTGNTGLLAKIATTRGALEQLAATLNDLTTQYSDVRTMVEKAGTNASVGALLRTHRRTLPNVRERVRNIRIRSEELASADVTQTELAIRRRPLSDVDALITGQLEPIAATAPEESYAALAEFVRSTLNEQKRILDELINDYSELFELLVAANVSEQEIIDRTNEFSNYIDERVFWVQSGRVFGAEELRYLPEAVEWIATPAKWLGVVSTTLEHARAHPAANGLLLFVFALLVSIQAPLRKQIRSLGVEAANSMCVSYAVTVRALVLTLAAASVAPAFMAGLSWRITRASDPTDFARAVAAGLVASSLFLAVFELFRQIARSNGLGIGHFGWPEKTLKAIRFHCLWASAIIVPGVFVMSAFDWNGEDLWTESLGRLVFVGSLIAVMAFAHALLRGKGPIRRAQSEGLIPTHRFFGAWVYPVTLAALFSLIVMAAAGYYYTAYQLSARFFITLCVGLGLLLALGMAARWLTIAHRRIAIAQYRERVMAKAAESESAAAEENKLDLSRTTVQTSRLTNSVLLFAFAVGVWLIWSGVLPALVRLEAVKIWEIEELSTTGDTVMGAITLADLVFAGIVGLVTAIAARNIPGILEIVLHRRFGLQAGERYALTTIVRYIIVIAGIIWISDSIGFGWSKVQWLVAALSLGIGFGLQEIVANFISGIILLFERPIRVGDTVTVGNVSGKVTRIRMRATTIMDWDCKELIVPNREFITGQIMNWTLSDKTLRVVVRVGVAYGSDTANVMNTLRRVATESELVLKNPAPVVVFASFGDSSLNFELRVYCASVEEHLPTLHEMHINIEIAFREQGIEFAYPHHDVNIRSIQDVVRLQRVPTTDAAESYAGPGRD